MLQRSHRLLFDQTLGHGNHLGMYAEQTGPSGETLATSRRVVISFNQGGLNRDQVTIKGRE
jgi:hypothetical protein